VYDTKVGKLGTYQYKEGHSQYFGNIFLFLKYANGIPNEDSKGIY
jgi:hypothetical protein